MGREFSLYLDLVRFAAALLVLAYHSNNKQVVEGHLLLASYGHEAVIVFFILSGFVIAYITHTKENTFKEYWASRLSRIYSIAIPAIILSPLLDWAGHAIAAQYYVGKTTHDLGLFRALTSFLFANEIWNISITLYSNVPYWSLCYEMWYYMMFAIVMFMKGPLRTVTFVAVCLLLGPKILILAPIWWLGVYLYRSETLRNIPEWLGWALSAASIALFVVHDVYGLTKWASNTIMAWGGPYWHRQMTFSKFFLADYPLAAIIMMNFVGMQRIAPRFAAVLLPLAPAIRNAAAYTFSIYLLHQPLLYFFAAVFHHINGDPRGYAFYLSGVVATLLSVIVISMFTEQKRHHLRRWIMNSFNALEKTAVWKHCAPRTPA